MPPDVDEIEEGLHQPMQQALAIAGHAIAASRRGKAGRPGITWDSPESRDGRTAALAGDGTVEPELVEGLRLADLSHSKPPEELVATAAAPARRARAAGKGKTAGAGKDAPGK